MKTRKAERKFEFDFGWKPVWRKPGTCSTCIHWKVFDADDLDSIGREYGHRLCWANPQYRGADPSMPRYPDTGPDERMCGRYVWGDNGLAPHGTYYKWSPWARTEAAPKKRPKKKRPKK